MDVYNEPKVKVKLDVLKGEKGEDATINGLKAINLIPGDQIILEQEGENIKVNATGPVPEGTVIDTEYVHTDNNYTTEEKTKLEGLQNYDDTEVKNEINAIIQSIGEINEFNVEVVAELPTENIDIHTIYLIHKASEDAQDVYDEYIYINEKWEHIGNTQIDLSSKLDVSAKATTEEAQEGINDDRYMTPLTTKEVIEELLKGKIDNVIQTISDCNDTTLKTGIYYAQTSTLNTPSKSGWFINILRKVLSDEEGNEVVVVTQTAYRYRDNEIWQRQHNHVEPVGWKDWELIHKDTGYNKATLTSKFKNYNNLEECAPVYRKVGKMVEIKGIVQPTSVLTATNNNTTNEIFTLPNGYIPAMEIVKRCQGSGMNTWLLNVKTDGKVSITRYGTTESVDVPSTAWLSFQITYFVD